MVAVPVVVLAVPSAEMVMLVALFTAVIVALAGMSVPVIVHPTSTDVKSAVVQVIVSEVFDTEHPLAVCIPQLMVGARIAEFGDGRWPGIGVGAGDGQTGDHAGGTSS